MPLRIVTRRQGVLWHGAFFVNHSLALVNRELVLALLDTDRFDIGIQHYENPVLGAEDDPRFAALASCMRTQPETPLVAVRHLWPPDFRRPAARRFALIQPWEYGSLPRAWVRGIEESVDEVWVPSQFVREEYVTSGVPGEKVFVVPNGVNTARFHPQVAPMVLPTAKGFKFLFVGGTIARKGIDVLLDAYTRAFSDRDDVSLIIKDFGAQSFYAGQGMGTLIEALRVKPGVPEIVYMTQDMTEAEIASLYAACDCLAHPYRGEGYGLPIAEAMACGKPAVVTNFGAALDFASEQNCCLIPAAPVRMNEKRVGDRETVDYPFWAEPDRDALAATLRRIYENPEEARAIGEKAARDIAAGHTWAHAARIAAERLESLHRSESAPAKAPIVTVADTVADYESRKQEALALTRAGEWQRAAERIEACLKERPEDWDMVNALAAALFRLGDKQRARELMGRGIAQSPSPRDFHHNLAFLLLDDGAEKEALDHAMAAFGFTPESPELRRTLERAREAVLRAARRIRRRQSGKVKRDETYRTLMSAVSRADELLSTKVENRQSKIENPTLSVVMIVRNEERFLRDCLESVRDAADEIVVVDTGSTDGTVAIAREFGAKVVSHAWDDDFSAARNVSLANATGEWALWMDADEQLAKGEAGLLRHLIETAEPNIGGYMVNIRNYMSLKEGADVCWHRACRLFRNLPFVRFTGRIHEQNARSLENAGYKIALAKLTLDHYGYAFDVMTERNKHERFIRMLTREVEENPDDTYRTFHLFNLANAYYTFGDMQSAIPWFEKADAKPEPHEEYTAMLYMEWATALYTVGRSEEALRVCDRAESLGIVHPGLDFARGHASLHLKEYNAAERYFRRSIEKGGRGFVAEVGDPGAYTYKAQYGLALAATGRDRYEETVGFCRAALAEKENFLDARYLLANALRRLNRLNEARREFEAVLTLAPEYDAARAGLACVLFDMEDFPAALSHLRRAASAGPSSTDLWLRLGVCCERLALYEEARDAFLTARRLAPQSPEVCVNLGRTFAALGDDARAIDCFAEAIQLDSRHANAYFNAADVLYRLGAYPKAAEMLCAGLELDPANAPGFFVLGNCCFQMRDYAAACRTYRTALSLKPDYAEARSNLELAEQMLTEAEQSAAA
jgi:tetratricopeptide (TPR) repeat protein